jgi:hypothetical protein
VVDERTRVLRDPKSTLPHPAGAPEPACAGPGNFLACLQSLPRLDSTAGTVRACEGQHCVRLRTGSHREASTSRPTTGRFHGNGKADVDAYARYCVSSDYGLSENTLHYISSGVIAKEVEAREGFIPYPSPARERTKYQLSDPAFDPKPDSTGMRRRVSSF